MMSSTYAQSTLHIKAFVQGFYTDTLYRKMLAIVDPANAPDLFDTMTVELYRSSNLNLSFSQKAIFNRNGDATVTLSNSLTGKSYYIVLHHRNGIETWSSFPVLMTNLTNYDFTSSVSQAYGNNLIWVTNAACIYSGDINQDGWIDTIDVNIWNADNNNFLSGPYVQSDLTGDGNADLMDFLTLDANHTYNVKLISPFTLATIANAEEKYVTIVPNPAQQYFDISMSDIVGGTKLTIYSSYGKKVEAVNLSKEIRNRIKVSKYPDGIYILKFNNDRKNFTKKMIVQH